VCADPRQGLGAALSLAISAASGLAVALVTLAALATYFAACIAVTAAVVIIVGAVAMCCTLAITAALSGFAGMALASGYLSLRVMGAALESARRSA